MPEPSSSTDLPAEADHLVIGGGIVGLAVARELLLRDPGRSVIVVEKEPSIAMHQTGHNSGVVHAGIYYRPDSKKTELTRRAIGSLRDYTAASDIPYIECGKLIVAISDDEETRLRDLYERATANRCPGIELIGPEGITEREPAATGHMAIWSPTTAITDFPAIAERLADDVTEGGGRIVLGEPVLGLAQANGHVTVSVGTTHRTVNAGSVVVCAGVQSDRLAVLAGDSPEPAVVPFRGEYLALAPRLAPEIRGLIYPVPDPQYPFLGVHFTRTVRSEVLVGPNAVLAFARNGYRWRDIDLGDLADLAGQRGFWRLAAKHWQRGAVEAWRSVNRRAYARDVARYVPAVKASDLAPAWAGVRAQAVYANGALCDDFVLSRSGRVVSVRNAPSPGATAALALAEDIVDLVGTPT